MANSLSNRPPALDWFSRRTAHADEYDPAYLADRKAATTTGISVVLPARNEAATIGPVVSAIAELAGTLVDEIVVIDAGSDDATADVAVAAGARVHQADRILGEYGPSLGKGDSLWRSLTVTGGDLVVFIDSDISNPDPKFVSGLVGPLLTDPSVHLVKAFYDRPVKLERVQYTTGGGRVTELLARPLLNLLWPDLAGLVQPLSGEYAARRSLLEALPFFTGYGVELGMLIDTADRLGAAAIAQVDLDIRIHRNQSLDALSRMSAGVLLVALRRLYGEGRAEVAAGMAHALPYTQFVRTEDGIEPIEHTVEIHERPPLRTLR